MYLSNTVTTNMPCWTVSVAGQTETAAVYGSKKPKKGVNQTPVPFSITHQPQKQVISKP